MKLVVGLLLVSVSLCAQTVEGDVFDSVTGAPLTGTLVRVRSAGVDTVVRTDVSGHFRISVPALNLQFSRAGYLGASRGFMQSTSHPISDLRIPLTPAAAISGKLTDEDGSPVEGAMVAAMSYQTVKGERKLWPALIPPVQTDDLGEYRLAGLPAGSYYIRAGAGNLGNWDRRYVPEFFPGGLQPTPDGSIEVKTGEERAGINLQFTRHEGVTVEGRLSVAGGADPRQTPPIYLQSEEFGSLPYHAARQTSDGTFRIVHVPPGVYKLCVASFRSQPRAGDLFSEQRLEVAGEAIRGVVLTAREVKPQNISGTIRLEDGRAPRPMVINLQHLSSPGVSAHSNDDGTFTLKGLQPGHYELQVVPEPEPDSKETIPINMTGYPVSARLGGQEVLENGFDLDGTPTDALQITVSNRMCLLSGKVLDATGQPAADTVVVIGSDLPVAVAITGSDGAFRVAPHAAGQYHIYVLGGQTNPDSLSDPAYRKAHENDFPPVTLVEGENPPVTLRLMPPRT